jgi:hypothetical protein
MFNHYNLDLHLLDCLKDPVSGLVITATTTVMLSETERVVSTEFDMSPGSNSIPFPFHSEYIYRPRVLVLTVPFQVVLVLRADPGLIDMKHELVVSAWLAYLSPHSSSGKASQQ